MEGTSFNATHSSLLTTRKVFSMSLSPVLQVWDPKGQSQFFFPYPHNLHNLLSCFSFIILYRFPSSALNLPPALTMNHSLFSPQHTHKHMHARTCTHTVSYSCTSTLQLMLQPPIDSKPQAYKVWCYFIFSVIYQNACKWFIVLQTEIGQNTMCDCVIVKSIYCTGPNLRCL